MGLGGGGWKGGGEGGRKEGSCWREGNWGNEGGIAEKRVMHGRKRGEHAQKEESEFGEK